MRVAVSVFDLHIPGVTSLKGKRKVIKSLIHRLRNRFNLSVSEIGYQDLWQRAELGMAVVCYNGAGTDSILEQIFTFIEAENGIEIIATRSEHY
ncbi:MAG: hypothetical protein AVO34_10445 [Firmicutes bacterium ML8_F2]|nr:MAG: hypothetical protein AVO34_10445 [Firmicutes bacterium ML8_F2]